MDCISDKITVSEDIGVYMWQSLGRRGVSFFLGVLQLTFCPYGETGGGGFVALHVRFVFAGPNCFELSREVEGAS